MSKSELYDLLAYLDIEQYVKVVPEIEKKDKEIERLNNIINELEKWLEENIKSKPLQLTYFFNCNGKQRSISEIELNELKRVFDKLQELKGSIKSE